MHDGASIHEKTVSNHKSDVVGRWRDWKAENNDEKKAIERRIVCGEGKKMWLYSFKFEFDIIFCFYFGFWNCLWNRIPEWSLDFTLNLLFWLCFCFSFSKFVLTIDDLRGYTFFGEIDSKEIHAKFEEMERDRKCDLCEKRIPEILMKWIIWEFVLQSVCWHSQEMMQR